MVLLTSCDVASGEAPCGPVCRCNWDGMQEARGSNPLSSTLPDTAFPQFSGVAEQREDAARLTPRGSRVSKSLRDPVAGRLQGNSTLSRPCATRARAGERALPQPPSSDSAATSAAGTPLILRRGIRRHSG